GTFRAQAPVRLTGNPTALVAADFDHNGQTDLAVTLDKPNGNEVAVLLGNGKGAFSLAGRTRVGGQSTNGLVMGDFNKDGAPDLAVLDDGFDNGPGNVSILLGKGGGSFETKTTVAVGRAPLGIASGDFKGDGNTDLVTTDSNSD